MMGLVGVPNAKLKVIQIALRVHIRLLQLEQGRSYLPDLRFG